MTQKSTEHMKNEPVAPQITVTPLSIISTKIHNLDLSRQDESEQKFNKSIEGEIAKMTKLTDVVTIQIPEDIGNDRVKTFIEKYRVAGWTIHLINGTGRVKYLRFLPLMDHQYQIFKPS